MFKPPAFTKPLADPIRPSVAGPGGGQRNGQSAAPASSRTDQVPRPSSTPARLTEAACRALFPFMRFGLLVATLALAVFGLRVALADHHDVSNARVEIESHRQCILQLQKFESQRQAREATQREPGRVGPDGSAAPER
jgi:hypothetical protein